MQVFPGAATVKKIGGTIIIFIVGGWLCCLPFLSAKPGTPLTGAHSAAGLRALTASLLLLIAWGILKALYAIWK